MADAYIPYQSLQDSKNDPLVMDTVSSVRRGWIIMYRNTPLPIVKLTIGHPTSENCGIGIWSSSLPGWFEAVDLTDFSYGLRYTATIVAVRPLAGWFYMSNNSN